ncbi:hypothetical protein BDQ12DRAFT_599653, partial [Crucibulum laeve]
NICRHFPHIVNLACQAILGAITNMDYAVENAEHFDPTSRGCDLIATIHTIHASSLCHDQFSKIQRDLSTKKVWELLHDVSTQWSSTQLMIEQALQLQRPIEIFLSCVCEFHKYKISDAEWEILEAYKTILSVPHAFQQKLSAEKMPTLCEALPSFQRMILVWNQLKNDMPAYSDVIDAGIQKLEDYYD